MRYFTQRHEDPKEEEKKIIVLKISATPFIKTAFTMAHLALAASL